MSFNALVLSGNPGAGKSSLLDELQARLGWEQHGIGKLLRREHKLWIQQNLPERGKITFTQYYSNRDLVSDDLIKLLNEELRKRILQGNVLADSRFATLNAEGIENAFTVYLQAPLKVRVTRSLGSKQYDNMRIEDIGADLVRRQALESQRGKEIYGVGFECHDSNKYSLVINNERLSIEEEADLICSLLS